jgi:hypothetical protein
MTRDRKALLRWRSGGRGRVKVSADGQGVVSCAGTALLRELATEADRPHWRAR